MSGVEALEILGANPELLDETKRSELDTRGFVIIPGVLDLETVGALRRRVFELLETEPGRTGVEIDHEKGALRYQELVNGGSLFDVCWNHPLLLSAVAHVLGWKEIHLSSLSARAAMPGEGGQGLHKDLDELEATEEDLSAGEFKVCNSIWMLDNFTIENGATRLVPGSHRSLRPYAIEVEGQSPLPTEVRVTGTAGSLVVFNSHLLHGGATNMTDEPRVGIFAYFSVRERKQFLTQIEALLPETEARLSKAQAYLLGIL
jgi:hypothetical protein